MFVDVVVKHKGQPERNIATIGRDSDYLDAVSDKFKNDKSLEYIKLELSTVWREIQQNEYE